MWSQSSIFCSGWLIVRPYVTTVPSSQERLILESAEARAVAVLELLLEHSIPYAMNLINTSLNSPSGLREKDHE
jgi:hypothetical protein